MNPLNTPVWPSRIGGSEVVHPAATGAGAPAICALPVVAVVAAAPLVSLAPAATAVVCATTGVVVVVVAAGTVVSPTTGAAAPLAPAPAAGSIPAALSWSSLRWMTAALAASTRASDKRLPQPVMSSEPAANSATAALLREVTVFLIGVLQ